MNKYAIRWLCAVVLVLASGAARATFHLWQLNEIYSNADGTVQYVELITGAGGQEFIAGHTLTSSQGATTRSFTFPSNLPADSAGRTFLVGTAGFAALGLVTPDYIVPDGFLFTTNGRVNFAGVDSVSWVALPIDGVLSISHSGAVAVNSPKNFAGVTGSVPGASPPICTLTASPVSISAGDTSTLAASCSPAATSYAWSANSGFGSTVAAGTVSPVVTTTYSVTGSNAAGAGNAATATVKVTVTPSTSLLTVTQSGAGAGVVTGSPAGINCGTSCSASFTNGTSVTLTATPAFGSTFAGWSGACNGTQACTVTMSGARDVTAVFVPVVGAYLLTVAPSGSGTGAVFSSPAGINCGTSCSGSFASGANITLTATAAFGSTFAGWSGACNGTQACTVTMSGARDVTAIFVAIVSAYSFDYVQKAYVAYYGRPGDPGGMLYWAGRMDAEGQSLNAIIGAFGYSDEFNRRYGGLVYTDLVTRIYQQALNRDPDAAGLNFYVGELEAGRRTLQTITLDVLNGATTAPDSTVIANKLEVAAYYTARVAAGCPYGTEQDGVSALSGVTGSPGTVTIAKAAIDAWCGP
jgi:hypothetical protein